MTPDAVMDQDRSHVSLELDRLRPLHAEGEQS